jgi:hypothetical protein
MLQLIDASSLKREIVEGTDIMVVRELTGGIYFGQPKGIETRAEYLGWKDVRVGYNTMIYCEPEVGGVHSDSPVNMIVLIYVPSAHPVSSSLALDQTYRPHKYDGGATIVRH